jgi:hypothetical protein
VGFAECIIGFAECRACFRSKTRVHRSTSH